MALKSGTCCLSGSLMKGCDYLGEGTWVGVYQATPIQEVQAGSLEQGSKPAVYMRLMLDQNTGNNRP